MESTAITQVPVEAIRPAGANDRKIFKDEALAELAASIKRNGLAQPVTVRPLGDGTYQLVCGERRWRAHQMAGIDVIEAIVRPDLDGVAASSIMLVENENRVDLNPIEQAMAYEARMAEFGATVEEVAEIIGRSPSFIRSRLALLKLNPELQELTASGGIWLSFAQSLTGLDSNRQIIAMRAFLHDEGMSQATWDALVTRLRAEQRDDQQVGMFDLDLVAEEYVQQAKAERRPGTTMLARLVCDLHEHLELETLPDQLAQRLDAAAMAWSGVTAQPDKTRKRQK